MTTSARPDAADKRPSAEVIADLMTAADNIRALAHAGYMKNEIAAVLGIRYQQVRHVLECLGITLDRIRDSAPREA